MEAKITATDEELAALLQLLHRALLHSGMDAVDAALHWKMKITAARLTIGKKDG
jgi:hypothetical protein